MTGRRRGHSHPPTVVFAAGGTGGHIYPAVAVADAMRELVPEVRVVFAGTSYGLENEIVPRAGYELEHIDVRYLTGVSRLKRIKHLLLLPRAAWQSWRLLRRTRAQLVVGAGGYVSGPVTAIAAMMRRQTAILEQNAIPGVTNRLLGKLVRRVFVSFERERYLDNFAADKIEAFGNPVRDMRSQPPAARGDDEALRVLVFGGSQGAKSLNEQMPRLFAGLGDAGAKVAVRHQTGRGRDAPVRAAYESARFAGRIEVTQFIHDMPDAYAWADLVVCRAGATTCAELKAAGKASILVPFPYAAHNHQEANARAMLDAGAAHMVLDADMTGDVMIRHLRAALDDPDRLLRMAERARSLAQPDAAENVARACLEMMGVAPRTDADALTRDGGDATLSDDDAHLPRVAAEAA